MLASFVDITTCLCDVVDMKRDLSISTHPCPRVMYSSSMPPNSANSTTINHNTKNAGDSDFSAGKLPSIGSMSKTVRIPNAAFVTVVVVLML